MARDIFVFAGEVLKRFGYLFYIVNPSSHNYESLSDVKDYYYEVIPIFYMAVLLEQIILYKQNKPLWRYNNTISSSCQGILMEISKIPCRGAEVLVYASIYKNYRIIDLPWDSSWTWIFCWIAHDFFYYWMHRISHQVNIFWAIHETHHAPDVMILPSALQSHMFLLPIHWLTYLPMALVIPPTTYYVHYQINIIYQFWLHSEIIDKLPAFVEFIFVTPSHHRAHHGRNRRYIDKNFGGFLVIWDRLFGTFEEEDEDDKPLYGLTKQMNSFNPLVIQFEYYYFPWTTEGEHALCVNLLPYLSLIKFTRNLEEKTIDTRQFRTIWKQFYEYKTIGHKLSVLFKGPGWSPGKPWVGRLEDIPDPAPKFEKYTPELPKWCIRYLQLHFTIFLINYAFFSVSLLILSKASVFVAGLYFTFSSIAFGFALDGSSYTAHFELMRCILYFLAEKVIHQEIQVHGFLLSSICIYTNRVVYMSSILLWIVILFFDQLRKVFRTLKSL